MKTTDLMIGDFVKHANGNVCVVSKIEQGRGFACRIGNSEYLWDYNNKFEPIPITEKILKENGFFVAIYSPTLYTSVELAVEGITIMIDDYFRVTTYNTSRMGDHVNTLCVKYVHELQHVLRLCGLTELADNFKVE